ncbi:shikimate kinase [Humidesulfovibrio mexicanus]|uniref:Shikimate kinase n=1 Tax=Humidesulfovibrio mexicanus TaxID=147047 RepID=A0A238YY68_9BACT|nr:homoserine kinase [Humidesulfovibrio mexicanus]SNR75942.1 shikimate kinase [Humidesulfovibrio mexicanus]
MNAEASSAPLPRLWPQGAISLIGMAGAGKSTLGRLLADRLGWAHVDTDRLIESFYGLPLQDLLDGLGLEAFLKAENTLVSMLNVRRAVISTGGSVVYGRQAMERLSLLGPVVHLDISLESFLKRVGDGGNRGLAIAPGRTREDLYHERQPLYVAAADFTVSTDAGDQHHSLERLYEWLAADKTEPKG